MTPQALNFNGPHTPTIARVMPKRIERWDSFSATNASPSEAKLTYVRLNSQTPCPPRGAVPVNQGRGFASMFHLSTPGSLSVMAATVPAMSGSSVLAGNRGARQSAPLI